MNKLRLFLENMLIYGIGGIISKAIPVIMIPIITRLLPNTSYYGINDLTITAASFCSAFAGMGMYDAMYRMFFEKDEENYKKEVCSTAANYVFITSFIIFVLMILCKRLIAEFFFGSLKYEFLVYISATIMLLGATNNIISAPIRMQNKRKIFIIANTIGPILSYIVAIYFIFKGYYLTALPFGAALSAFIMEISFYSINRKWFRIGFINRSILKQLLLIGIPLLPNFLIYWIFNSSDKLMIANLLSVGAVGIYSVGSKLGHASQLIYTAFAGGWQYFAFSTMKEEKQVESNSLVFEYLGAISFVAGMFMCALSKPVFQILFTGEYVNGYIVAPYLFLAPLLQMLFQTAGNQFLVIKKTWPIMWILLIGAIVNILLNFYLIPILGIEGAAIATLSGYSISLLITVVILSKIQLFKVTSRLMFSSFAVLLFFVIWRLFFNKCFQHALLLALAFSIFVISLYRDEIKYLVNIIKSFKRKKGSI